jgi:hypothetical protein
MWNPPLRILLLLPHMRLSIFDCPNPRVRPTQLRRSVARRTLAMTPHQNAQRLTWRTLSACITFSDEGMDSFCFYGWGRGALSQFPIRVCSKHNSYSLRSCSRADETVYPYGTRQTFRGTTGCRIRGPTKLQIHMAPVRPLGVPQVVGLGLFYQRS